MYMKGKSLSIPLPQALGEWGFTGGSRGDHNADNRERGYFNSTLLECPLD